MVKYLNVQEAARLLRVSKQALYQRISKGQLRHRIIGGYILIPSSEVETFAKDDTSEHQHLRRLKKINKKEVPTDGEKQP